MARRRRNRGATQDVASAFGIAGGAATHAAGGRKKGGRKGSIRNVGSAISGVGASSSKPNLKRAQKAHVRAATRAVQRYAAGEKEYRPTVAQIRTAWPSLSDTEKSRLGSALVSRALTDANTGDTPGPTRPLPDFLRKYNEADYDQLSLTAGNAPTKSDTKSIAKTEPTAGEVAEVASLLAPLPVGGALKLGATALRTARAARTAEEVAVAGRGAKLAEGAAETTRAATSARRGSRAVSALKSTKAARAARTAATGTKARVAESALGRGAKATGRGAKAVAASKPGRIAIGTGKVAVSPARHPVKVGTPLYLGTAAAGAVPAAVEQGSGKPVISALGNALTGGKTAATDALDAARDFTDNFGVVGNAAQDILELPAAAVPSTFLLGQGIVKAIGGDDSMLKAQLNDYVDSGFLPGLAKGDIDQAVTALKEHPVFSALEAYGAGSVVDRGVGLTLPAKARDPLQLPEGLGTIERNYSKSAIARGFQERADRKRADRNDGEQRATGRETERYLGGGLVRSGKGDYVIGGSETHRRAVRGEDIAATEGQLVRQRPKGLGAKTSQANRDGVTLVSTVRVRARSFKQDLGRLVDEAEAKFTELKTREAELKGQRGSKEELGRVREALKANREMKARIENVRDHGDPEVIYAQAGEIVPYANKKESELIDAAVGLDADQALRSKLFPAGQFHLGLKYGVPTDKLTADAIAVLKRNRDGLTKQIDALQEKANKATNLQARDGFLKQIDDLKAERDGIDQEIAAGPASEQIIDADGRSITTEEIIRRLEEQGVEDPVGMTAFVTQRPGARGSGSFWKPWYPSRQQIPGGKRTGASTFEGWDVSADALVEQVVRSGQIAEAAKTYDHAVNSFVPRTETGQVKTFQKMNTGAVRDPEAYGLDPSISWRAVRLPPEEKVTRRAEDIGDLPPDDVGVELELASRWADANTDGVGRISVIPEVVAKRFDAHFARPGTGRMVMQAVNGAFKGTVLPYSPKWLVGNFTDINIRAAIAGHPPIQAITSLNMRFADQIFEVAETVDPEGAARAKALLAPGQHMASVENTRTVRKANGSLAATEIAPIAHTLSRFREAPGLRTMFNFHDRYKTWVFSKNDEWIEAPPQMAHLGKQLKREARERGFIKRWESVWSLEDEARIELARGLLNTDKQMKYAKGIERVFGQWANNSPEMRRLLVDFAPFGMWTRAATSFVFRTLPVDHPVLTGMIAATEQMTQEERNALGLSFFADEALPPNLQGGIPTPGGGLRGSVSDLSSFGYFADVGDNYASVILPQFSGVLDSLRGLTWTGDQLLDENGQPASEQQRFVAALTQGLEAYAPLLAVGQRVSTASEADSVESGALDLLIGKELEPGIVDYLRKPRKSIEVVTEGSGESSYSPYSGSEGESSTSSSFFDGYSSGGGSSSSSSSGFFDGYGG